MSLRKKRLTQDFREMVQDPEEGTSDSSSSSRESCARCKSTFHRKEGVFVKQEVKKELETPTRRFLHTVSGSSMSLLALYEWLMEDPNPAPEVPDPLPEILETV